MSDKLDLYLKEMELVLGDLPTPLLITYVDSIIEQALTEKVKEDLRVLKAKILEKRGASDDNSSLV